MAEFLAWKKSNEAFFGAGGPDVERLQQPWPADAPSDLVETSYFGFCVPEASLNCEIYHWAHPKLGIVSGGVMIYRRCYDYAVNCDHLDFRNYIPLTQELSHADYPTGLKIRTREPLKEFEISYHNEHDDTRFEFRSTAIMPPAFRPNGGHFTQAMRNRGTLTLGGEQFRIEGYFARDRSWGDPRPEQTFDIPAASWHTAQFSDELAFHVIATESVDWNPATPSAMPQHTGNFIWGYLWQSGRLLGIRACRKRITRGANGVAPAAVDLELLDETGKVHKLTGRIVSGTPFNMWPNLMIYFCLTQWTYEGQCGHGETQEGWYTHAFRKIVKDQQADLT